MRSSNYNLPAVKLTCFDTSLFNLVKANTSQKKVKVEEVNCMANFNVRRDFLAFRKNTRFYSSMPAPSLSPWFITGFTDAEGSFMFIIRKVSDTKTGWRVVPTFQIELHRKDDALLAEQAYLNLFKLTSKE
jgi:hypothetical protein